MRDIVEQLLRAGAEIDVANSIGDTPITLAEEQGYTDIVDMLRRAREGNQT